MRKRNSMSTRATWQKLQIFKIQDGGRPPFWQWLNRHISVKNRPILMKLGTLHQILNPMTVTWPKIEIFKIQDGGGRHLKNRFLAITHQPIVRFQRFLYEEAERHIDKGYGTKKCKFLKSKMADGRHFVNCQIAISQWKIIRFRWNSVHYSKCWTRLQSRDQKLIVLKFKMAATAILKIVKSPYLSETIIGFWQNLVYYSIY